MIKLFEEFSIFAPVLLPLAIFGRNSDGYHIPFVHVSTGSESIYFTVNVSYTMYTKATKTHIFLVQKVKYGHR